MNYRKVKELGVISMGMWLISGCQAQPLALYANVGAETVTVHDFQDLPDIEDCEPIGRLTAEDGLIGPGYLWFDGTDTRALIKLRNEATYFGANTVVIVDSILSLAKGNNKGQVMKYYADGYNCR